MTMPKIKIPSSCPTIRDMIHFGVHQAEQHQLCYGHGTDNAWDEITALVLGCLNLSSDSQPALMTTILTAEEQHHVANALTQRIIDRIPLPYILNEIQFCQLSFYVDPRVLIPRSPIAELIEQQFSPWLDSDHVHNILELCTGSGCIAIACAYAIPHANIDASDLSQDALAVASINQKKHSSVKPVNFIHSDCWNSIPNKQYDLIISNPPYVGEEELKTLPREYTYEPQMALLAADNGLALTKTILLGAHHYLSKNGAIIIEVGNTAETLMETFPNVPFTWIDFERGGDGVFILTKQELECYFS